MIHDGQFIAHHKEDVFVDSNGVIHGLLALDRESGDGILIDSSGYDYARYSAFMSNIKPYLDEQITLTADKIIKDAITNADNSKWSFDIGDASECYEIPIRGNNGIGGMLISALRERQEIGEIMVEGSDPCYSFHWIGESDTLYVFETPVDMLSFITLNKQDWTGYQSMEQKQRPGR